MYYLVISRYLKGPADIDSLMVEHQAFLDVQYRRGCFLLSGPRTPRDGGVILAQTHTREELLEVLELDPFRIHGLIDYDVLNWNLNRRSASLPEALFPGSKAVQPGASA